LGLGLWLGLGLGATGPTGPTSRRARVSEPTRATRPTNPRLSANPSHRHKRLLIYRRCRCLFIFPLLTYCCARYVLFAQDSRRKGGVSEVEVIQNRPFIRVGRYGHFWTAWTSQKDFIYPVSQTAEFLKFLRKLRKSQFFLHENVQ